MKVLIVEDENLLAKQLAQLLAQVEPQAEVIGRTNSIRSTVQWLQENEQPDLLLMDIELADGQCFEIFRQAGSKIPVIFTTAYDEFTLRAFKQNSIDYLLKPIREEELRAALQKFRELRSVSSPHAVADNLMALLEQAGKTYRDRFLVRQGQKMVSVMAEQVAYFWTSNKLCYLITRERQKFLLDHPLDDLEQMLDPRQFFRANRQLILAHDMVQAVYPWFKGKLKVEVVVPHEEEVIISREKAAQFKAWMGA